MTSPEQSQSPEDPQNPETPETQESEQNANWQSAALNADHSVRSAVDRVRPTASRLTDRVVALLLRLRQWLAPFIDRVQEKAGPGARKLRGRVEPYVASVSSGTSGGKHQARPSRLRAMQVGAAMAAVGVVGVLIGSLSTPSDSPQVEAAAEVAAVPAPGETQEQADARQAERNSEAKSRPPQQQSEAMKAQAGMDIPANAPGIDVSNHNGSIDWGQVAGSGQKYSFVLASDGDDFTSPTFDEQYNGAKNAGMLAGAYHFGRPSSSAVDQANLLLETTGGYQNDGHTLPPVLDMEVDPDTGGCYGKSTEEMHGWMGEFTGKVKQATGKDPIIYASPSFWQNCMGDSQAFSENPLWLASYGVDNPSVPGGWSAYSFWQYTESGSVPGISGPVDMNRFQGSGEQLKQLAR